MIEAALQAAARQAQIEETKAESIKKDKMATEKLLQETIEKYQADLAVQKEFYANELKLAKEAEALSEARANSEARLELGSRLKESGERESMLVQALKELRQALTRTNIRLSPKRKCFVGILMKFISDISFVAVKVQITSLRTEQGQLSRTLEKERQRSAENRQEYLIAKEDAATLEGHANQFEDEIKELKGIKRSWKKK